MLILLICFIITTFVNLITEMHTGKKDLFKQFKIKHDFNEVHEVNVSNYHFMPFLEIKELNGSMIDWTDRFDIFSEK